MIEAAGLVLLIANRFVGGGAEELHAAVSRE